MKRRRMLPVLAIFTIGTLIAGSLMCVLGTLQAGKLAGLDDRTASQTYTPAPSPTAQATSRTSPADKPAPSATPTLAPSQDGAASTAAPTTTPPAGGPAAATPTPSATVPRSTPLPTKPSPSPTVTSPPDPIPSATAMPTSAPARPISGPTDTPDPSDSPAVPDMTPSPTPVAAAPLEPATLSGRLVKDGIPVSADVTVKLEDQNYAIFATTSTDENGFYTFDNLTTLGQSLNVLFAQEWNEQYDIGEVVSWAWLGPVTLSSGSTVELPDIDIALLGLNQISPTPGTSLPGSQISAQNPVIFEWTPQPAASSYWVDLTKGDELTHIWQSVLVETTSVAFDGSLDDGSQITPDTYWWGIGARRDIGNYRLTIYGYLPTLVITP